MTDPAGTDLVVFRVADRSCALPAGCVEAALHLPQLARTPACPSLLEGFLVLADRVVPVVRAGQVLGLRQLEPGLYSPLVLFAAGGQPLALLVDRIDEVVRGSALRAVAAGAALNGCVAAAWSRAGDTVHVLDPDRLLLRQERERAAQLAAEVRRRLDDLAPTPPSGA